MVCFERNIFNVCPCKEKKSLVVSYILLISLGYTGAHHFYLGRRMFGMMYFLTFGLCGFGYLVDYFRLPGLVEEANDNIFTSDEEIDSKSNADAYILWFPCGIIGFHHFYLGNYHLGLLYMLTFGVYWAGWAIDFFRIPSLVSNSNIPPDMIEKTNNLTTTYLMTLSPFGILGAQHYYLRRWKWGLLYTCTGGIFIFGWLFDVFRIPNLVSRENKKLKGENIKLIYTDDVYLLWLSFGIFGAHHYFLGRKTLALVYLFTLGVFGFGWLIDLFRIPYLVATKNYHKEKEEISDNKISFFHQVIYQSDEERINNTESRRKGDLSIFLKRNNNAFAETCNQEQLVFNDRSIPFVKDESISKAAGKLGPKKPTRFSYTTTMVETFTLDDEIDKNGMLGRDLYSSTYKTFAVNEDLALHENTTKQKLRQNKSGQIEINCLQDGTKNNSILPPGEVSVTRTGCFKGKGLHRIESLTCSAINKHVTDSASIAITIKPDTENKPKSRKAMAKRLQKDTDDILFKPRKGLENSFDQNRSKNKTNVALVSKTYQLTNECYIMNEHIRKNNVRRKRKRQIRNTRSSVNTENFVKSESKEKSKRSTMSGNAYVENMNTEVYDSVGCMATTITDSNSVRYVHQNYLPGPTKDNENQLLFNQQPEKQIIFCKSKDYNVHFTEEYGINLNTEKNKTTAGKENISVASIAQHSQTKKPQSKLLFVNENASQAISAPNVENFEKKPIGNREYFCNEIFCGDKLNYRLETSVSSSDNMDKRWSNTPVQKSRDHHTKVPIEKSKCIQTLSSKESFNEANANKFTYIEQARKLRKRSHRIANKSVRNTNHKIVSEEDISMAHYNNIPSGNVYPQTQGSVKSSKTSGILPAYSFVNTNDVTKTNVQDRKIEIMRQIKKKSSSLECDTEIPNDNLNHRDVFIQKTRKMNPLTEGGYDKPLETRTGKKDNLSKLHHIKSGIVRDSGLIPRKNISASVPDAEGDVYSMTKHMKNDVKMKIEQGRHGFNKGTNGRKVRAVHLL